MHFYICKWHLYDRKLFLYDLQHTIYYTSTMKLHPHFQKNYLTHFTWDTTSVDILENNFIIVQKLIKSCSQGSNVNDKFFFI